MKARMMAAAVTAAAGLAAASVLPAAGATVPTKPAAASATALASARSAHFAGAGFDACFAPSTGVMRSWLDSPYRAMNFYLGGSQLSRDCRPQTELTAQWVSTVRTNGWALIPTWVGLQAPCRSNTKKKAFTLANARRSGQSAAQSAVAAMKALGLGPHKPVYVDLEPYDTGRTRCVNAVLDYVEAWTNTMHRHHYVAGIYAHATLGVEPIARYANPRPDDVWWALYDGHKTTSYPTLHGHWRHHRIHQYSAQTGSTTTSHHGQAIQIDRDSVDADVVGPYVARTPSGPPYRYRASPPVGTPLQERTAPTTTAPASPTPAAYGDVLHVVCQRRGQKVFGDPVWDLLANGYYVADLYLTTTGGLSFTPGLARCS